MTTFESLLAGLARAGVEFVVVGGLAVAAAGFARVTDAVDLLVEASEANLVRLLAALRPFSEAAAELTPADFPLEEGAVRVAEAFDLDLYTRMSGHAYADLLPLSAARDVGGVPVRFLGAEGLIRLKVPSLRPKDQLDVQVLHDLLVRRAA
jgi:hypothetical protein